MPYNQNKTYACSLAINKSCYIQSKALVKSVNNMPVVSPLSNVSLSFSNIKSKQCWVLWTFLNPPKYLEKSN